MEGKTLPYRHDRLQRTGEGRRSEARKAAESRSRARYLNCSVLVLSVSFYRTLSRGLQAGTRPRPSQRPRAAPRIRLETDARGHLELPRLVEVVGSLSGLSERGRDRKVRRVGRGLRRGPRDVRRD